MNVSKKKIKKIEELLEKANVTLQSKWNEFISADEAVDIMLNAACDVYLALSILSEEIDKANPPW